MEGYKDYGWANSWGSYENAPQPIKDCRAAKHVTTDIDKGNPPHKGLDHVVTCDICKIVHHYDSSD